MSNFQKDVIADSHAKPVVVDFWAPWCGPCRVLGPVIEKIAEEQRDQWKLVKINTEEQPELAQQYDIRSIPNVKMFYKGEVKAEFLGALPKPAIEKWLEQNLPDDRKEDLAQLLATLEEHPGEKALERLKAFTKENDDLPEAKVALATKTVFKNPDEAMALVEDIKMGNELYDTASDIRTIGSFLSADLEDTPVEAKLEAAQKAIRAGNDQSAIESIIQAVTIDKSFQEGLPRRLAIALFRIWGNKHELTKSYRRRFDMALY